MSSSSSSEIGDMSEEKPASWTAVETGSKADKLRKQGKKDYEKIVKERKKAADKVIKKRKKAAKKAEKKAVKDSLAQQELDIEDHVKKNVGNMRSISVNRAASRSPLKIMDPNKERPEDKVGYDKPFANRDTIGDPLFYGMDVKSAKSPKSSKKRKSRKKRKTRKTKRKSRRRSTKQMGRGRLPKGQKRKTSKKKKPIKKNTGQKSRQSAAKKAVKELMKACQKAEDDNGPDGINAMGNRFNCGEDISPKMQTALDGADAKQAHRALKEVKSKTAAYKRAVRTGNIDEIF